MFYCGDPRWFGQVSKSSKFEIPKVNGKHFAMWKVKIHVILLKDECAIALKGNGQKPHRITDTQFVEKDDMLRLI